MARSSSSDNSTANPGFEAKLWLAADKLRSNMDAAECKHVVLGLIFLKYISDAFEEHHAKLITGEGDYAGADPEDPDEYKTLNVFWVPPGARWTYLQNSAKQPDVLANPPFNDSDWFRKDNECAGSMASRPRATPTSPAVQHFIHHLAPHGMAGFKLANGT
jgi:type I restriction-modification system DNA methylase subunit